MYGTEAEGVPREGNKRINFCGNCFIALGDSFRGKFHISIRWLFSALRKPKRKRKRKESEGDFWWRMRALERKSTQENAQGGEGALREIFHPNIWVVNTTPSERQRVRERYREDVWWWQKCGKLGNSPNIQMLPLTVSYDLCKTTELILAQKKYTCLGIYSPSRWKKNSKRKLMEKKSFMWILVNSRGDALRKKYNHWYIRSHLMMLNLYLYNLQ